MWQYYILCVFLCRSEDDLRFLQHIFLDIKVFFRIKQTDKKYILIKEAILTFNDNCLGLND